MKSQVKEAKAAWRDSDVLILRCGQSGRRSIRPFYLRWLELGVWSGVSACQGFFISFFHVRGRSEEACFSLVLYSIVLTESIVLRVFQPPL